ncbi:hypothetical protein Bcep18194_C6799 [Burkholderia lata]|uniref:Uncharacterized protein n=1 Tax=Burkholderia lata (strain ATCC 17760 / DSM 23089 / LMG 22485 / NCIMB 9086 / R18194 / 383) TaxID=482957 RepID=Q39NX0_BURL3|nr:hypothetical protein Bcep18194_C6799 [Burkholderia lata]
MLDRPAAHGNVLACARHRLAAGEHGSAGNKRSPGALTPYASATVTPEYFSVTFNKVKPLNPDEAAPADALLGRTRLTVPSDSVEVRVEHL